MLVVLVTLFNKKVAESTSIQSLLKGKELLKKGKVIIWDNSAVKLSECDISELNQNFNLIYIHTAENAYLSRIYNEVSSRFINYGDYFLLLDDDSTFERIFLEKILNAIETHNTINLFLPIVKSDNDIISPAFNYVFKNSRLRKRISGICSTKYLTAINSGMIISSRVFNQGFRWDTRLKFYGTDNFFMYRFRIKYKQVFIIDSTIDHNLTFNSSSIEKKAIIFSETKKSNYIIFDNNKLNLILVTFNNIMVSIILSFKYKSFKFFR